MEDTNKKYSRTRLHELAMICLYQFLVYSRVEEKPDLKGIIESVMDQPLKEVDPLVKKIVVQTISNMPSVIAYLDHHLTEDWEFRRLNYINQALLMMGYVEIVYLAIPKPVAINVCVKLAQKFSDDDAYKMINGILDTVQNDGAK